MIEQYGNQTIDAGISSTPESLMATKRQKAQAWLEKQARLGVTSASYSESVFDSVPPPKECGTESPHSEVKHSLGILAEILKFLR